MAHEAAIKTLMERAATLTEDLGKEIVQSKSIDNLVMMAEPRAKLIMQLLRSAETLSKCSNGA